MESKNILSDIINDFETVKLVRFFRQKSRSFAPLREDLLQYEDDNFKSGLKLGEIRFNRGEQMLVCTFRANQPISEKSGKKSQYEKAKRILRETQSDAGLFIFYDEKNNFRFSLIYANYRGTRRDWSNFRRFTYFVSKELTNKTFLQRIGAGDFSSLEKIKDAFSVEKVTRAFYADIANWYFWAVQKSEFPQDADKNVAVIRLITRLIFIWFMREQGLVPKELFQEPKINDYLKDLSPEQSTYYKAILQNLFFATLNTKQEERDFISESRGHKGYNPDFGKHYLFRYHELFKNPQDIESYFSKIPFLNGGLFECLDNKKSKPYLYIDGFTFTKKHQPKVPNLLFFSDETEVDLNADYGTKKKKYKAKGLLNILSSYNFTIDENVPDDQEVALDPELLGKVFENLLASFNPETASTARKATGSYYTPREIVDYMVTQSLKEYFKTHLVSSYHSDYHSNCHSEQSEESLDEKIDRLFANGDSENPFTASVSKRIVALIDNLRIVDPAVGSGAFPMGVLNRLVFILSKLDPENKLWKETQMKAVEANVSDPILKKKLKEQIQAQFAEKNFDYGRKLYLIQKCIYGVDIQQIAVEIARLRFFIALLVDEKIDKSQKNWGIEPLPNLDFKIMQGNSLISEFRGINFDGDAEKNNGQMFSEHQEAEELINEFQQKKNEFQNEPDKDKKDNLKQKVDDLMIQILETKLKKQRRDCFTELKAIKDKYSILPNKQQREEIIAKKKQVLSKKEGFDLEKFESQLREFSGKNKTKPFFAWKLYFAEVFQGDNPGFDIVIANPPYVRADSGPGYLAFRKKLEKLKTFQTLYEKWDLMVPFIERGLDVANTKGNLIYIVSNAICTSKYAFKLLDLIQEKYFLRSIDYFDNMAVFEAGVIPVVLHVGKTDGDGKTKKNIHCGSFENIESQSSVLTEEFKSLGRDAFRKEYNPIVLKTRTISLGDICYMSKGMVINADEKTAQGKFVKDDLISEKKTKTHSRSYIEGKDINSYVFKRFRYLEWGTNRVPRQLSRATFPELYDHSKIMRGRVTGGIYDETGLLCNDSIVVFVRFIELYGVNNKSIQTSIKKFNLLSKIELENISKKFNLKYLLAVLNSSFAFKYLNNIRRHRLKNYFYPDDFRKLPIADITPEEQRPFINLVDKILAITSRKDYDLKANSELNKKVQDYEKQIDQMVYKLYGLTKEEIKIVEDFK